MSRNQKLIVFVAVLASLLEIVDASIVNVAIPTMMGNLGATLEDISMVITGYAMDDFAKSKLAATNKELVEERAFVADMIG